ncbi:hypothetical protein M422DRAFT_251882 [Sphaerobolus stellatus SS14]|uniref:Unplaced genomic scaffold SPHSTscaffold_41, whole genome shotgun sequence n=1 Tax=Sphaerobolus stellatus (strain SS14) TaxID=990650 RepID=A0A0C9VC93_SPHS4|nr:hypothetical protein M422DRAFT_251882 [Sphaerobolus stellatus SS14]
MATVFFNTDIAPELLAPEVEERFQQVATSTKDINQMRSVLSDGQGRRAFEVLCTRCGSTRGRIYVGWIPLALVEFVYQGDNEHAQMFPLPITPRAMAIIRSNEPIIIKMSLSGSETRLPDTPYSGLESINTHTRMDHNNQLLFCPTMTKAEIDVVKKACSDEKEDQPLDVKPMRGKMKRETLFGGKQPTSSHLYHYCISLYRIPCHSNVQPHIQYNTVDFVYHGDRVKLPIQMRQKAFTVARDPNPFFKGIAQTSTGMGGWLTR